MNTLRFRRIVWAAFLGMLMPAAIGCQSTTGTMTGTITTVVDEFTASEKTHVYLEWPAERGQPEVLMTLCQQTPLEGSAEPRTKHNIHLFIVSASAEYGTDNAVLMFLVDGERITLRQDKTVKLKLTKATQKANFGIPIDVQQRLRTADDVSVRIRTSGTWIDLHFDNDHRDAIEKYCSVVFDDTASQPTNSGGP